MLGFRATPENVAAIREELGLDEPLLAQYGSWLADLFRGDFGKDYVSGAPLSSLLATSLPVTIELTVLAMTLATLVGVPLGVLAASRGTGLAGRDRRRSSSPGSASPTSGSASCSCCSSPARWAGCRRRATCRSPRDLVGNLRYMVLPVVDPGDRRGRLHRPHHAERDRGRPRPAVHAATSAPRASPSATSSSATRCATPASRSLTVIGIQFGVLLGGSIVIEYAFGLPGLGRLTVVAINQRNYTVVQGGDARAGGDVHRRQPASSTCSSASSTRASPTERRHDRAGDHAHRPRRRRGRSVRRADRRLIIGASILGVLVVVAVLAPWIAPHDPESIDSARLLVGADAASPVRHRCPRPRRAVAACSTPSASRCSSRPARSRSPPLVGIPLGLLSGYSGGRVDLVADAPGRHDPRAPRPAAGHQPDLDPRHGHVVTRDRHRRHLLPDPRPGDALVGAGRVHAPVRRRVARPRDGRDVGSPSATSCPTRSDRSSCRPPC